MSRRKNCDRVRGATFHRVLSRISNNAFAREHRKLRHMYPPVDDRYPYVQSPTCLATRLKWQSIFALNSLNRRFALTRVAEDRGSRLRRSKSRSLYFNNSRNLKREARPSFSSIRRHRHHVSSTLDRTRNLRTRKASSETDSPAAELVVGMEHAESDASGGGG